MSRRKCRNGIKPYEKILKSSFDFDWTGLIRLEKKKLEMMELCFSDPSLPKHQDSHIILRDLRICISLAEIILEEDKIYKNWIEDFSRQVKTRISKNGVLDIIGSENIKPKTHINLRNSHRFGFSENIYHLPSCYLELRKMKALKLYNKIRNRLFSWWV